MTKVRMALIGAGMIGKRHIDVIAASSQVDLVAIADPADNAAQIASQAGVPHFRDAQAMLEAVKPDGVIVATPTEHHLSPCLAAMDASAHVLVEKPITATAEEAEAMIARSSETGCHVLVGHHRRYYPQVHRAREIVQGGDLGRLIAVTGQWNVRKHDAYYAPDWRKRWKAGPVLINLIHDMDCIRYICGEVVSVSAEISNHVMGWEKEDAAALVMKFENGALGTFILSDQSSSPWAWEFASGENPAFPKSGQNVLRIMGTDGALEFPNLVQWRADGEPNWNRVMRACATEMEYGDAFVRQIEHFCAVIRGEEEPRITAGDAARSLYATLAVFKAAESGARVKL